MKEFQELGGWLLIPDLETHLGTSILIQQWTGNEWYQETGTGPISKSKGGKFEVSKNSRINWLR